MNTQETPLRRKVLLLAIPLLIMWFGTGSILIGSQEHSAHLTVIACYIVVALLIVMFFAVLASSTAVAPASVIIILVCGGVIIGRVWEVNFGEFRSQAGDDSVFIGIYSYIPALFFISFMILSKHRALVYSTAVWLTVSVMIYIANTDGFNQLEWPEGLDHLTLGVWVAHPILIAATYLLLPYAEPVACAEVETKVAKDALKAMQELALGDKLTGLYNRHFLDIFWDEFSDQSKYKPHYLLLFIVDIDNFKTLTDTAGRLKGDAVLKKVSAELAKFADDFGGHAVRYDGEEFLILVPSEVDLDVLSLAGQIHYSIKDLRIPYPAPAIKYLSVSIGATSAASSMSTSESDWMRAADAALYDAKSAGRNCTSVRSLTKA
ncbi:MAG: diguanylate cyclase (GGDEF)-like protein [Gammaproteobacteria bacterium]|jgi:diguanylate cyclase (GGDEF)-like protein